MNEDGEDAGVVYSEMQDDEHTGTNMTHRALLRALYPEGCGYRSEVGGESKLEIVVPEFSPKKTIRDFVFRKAEKLANEYQSRQSSKLP